MDPYDLAQTTSKDEILGMMEESLFLSDFIINESSSLIAIRRHQPELVRKVVERLESFLNQAPEGLFRDTIAYEISNLNNIPIKRIPAIDISGDIKEAFVSDLEALLERHPGISIRRQDASFLRLVLDDQGTE